MIARNIMHIMAGAILLISASAMANHPVIVEGNNVTDGPQGTTTTILPGTGGDYDGDGVVGIAEDADNATDRVFGTIGAALRSANGGANANGSVTIVTSGRFGENINIPDVGSGQATLNGVTVIEGAPGVSADINAVIAGDAAGNAIRQDGIGINISSPDTDKLVILRNLTIRNFNVGVQISGNVRVIIENCKFESNLAHNIIALDSSRVTIVNTSVNAAGMRFNPVKGTPNPGNGISVLNSALAYIRHCNISGNTAAGIQNASSRTTRVFDTTVSDNGQGFVGTNFQVEN